MKKKVFLNITKIVSVLLAMSLITGAALATDEGIQPLASDYFFSTSTYIQDIGNGNLSIQFAVNGTGIMDQIGVSSITLRRSSNGNTWSTIKTFKSEDYPQMLGRNRSKYSGYVPYSVTEGWYYQASVTFYASDNYGSDSVTISTSPVWL